MQSWQYFSTAYFKVVVRLDEHRVMAHTQQCGALCVIDRFIFSK